MKNLKTLLLVLLASVFMLGCSGKLGGKIVVIDGKYYELQHRLALTYLLHEISPEEFERARKLLNVKGDA